jgi:hypothetical protein
MSKLDSSLCHNNIVFTTFFKYMVEDPLAYAV